MECGRVRASVGLNCCLLKKSCLPVLIFTQALKGTILEGTQATIKTHNVFYPFPIFFQVFNTCPIGESLCPIGESSQFPFHKNCVWGSILNPSNSHRFLWCVAEPLFRGLICIFFHLLPSWVPTNVFGAFVEIPHHLSQAEASWGGIRLDASPGPLLSR